MLNTGIEVGLGTRPSKRNTTDVFILIMRDVISEGAGDTKYDVETEFLKRCRQHSDYEDELHPKMLRAFAGLIYDRVAVRKRSDHGEADRLTGRAKAVIARRIVWWNWRLPTVNKLLRNCTFEEVRVAAPTLGRLLGSLAAAGDPDQKVKDVFSRESLQEFFKGAP